MHAGKPIKYAIVEYTTNKNFCNVYDALAIERLEWELVSYDREQRVHIQKVNAFLPVLKGKLLVHHVLSGISANENWKMEVFGGSFREDTIESRLFKADYDVGPNQQFARFPYRLAISIGPGKKISTGGIAPAGKPTQQVIMRFPEDDFVGICLEIRDHLLVHQRDLEAVRRANQQTRFAEIAQKRTDYVERSHAA